MTDVMIIQANHAADCGLLADCRDCGRAHDVLDPLYGREQQRAVSGADHQNPGGASRASGLGHGCCHGQQSAHPS